jgi:hypothetical protein
MKAKTTITGVALALAIALVTGVTPALAVHDVGLFELDRDAIDSNGAATLPDDWDTVNLPLPLGSGGSSFAHTGVIQESEPDSSKFTGGGSKDNNDLNQWQFITGNPTPDKDNITNGYAAAYTNPADGDLITYFGLDRKANNGSAQVGFWFFQNPVQLCTDPANQNNCTVGTFVDDSGAPAAHAVGDILIQSNFSQGGVISSITVFEWVGSNGSNGALNQLIPSPTITAADCVPGISADPACGTVNQADTPAPWPYTPKFGKAQIFPQGSFYEGGLDITKVLPGTTCFSTFMAETRSSTPFDAVLKDFAGPAAFNTCGIKVTKNCDVAFNTGGNNLNVHVSGTVCNEGVLPATVTSLVDDKAGDLLPSLSSNPLAPKGQPGECATYSGDYTSTTRVNSDTVTVEATQGGQTVPGTANATCEIPIPSAITVDKTCGAAVNTAGTGVDVTFSGKVCNTGPDALKNVSVIDDKGGVTTQPSSTLAPGTCSNYSGGYASTTCPNSDTVTASGTGVLSGTTVQSVPATASCAATCTPGISVTKDCINKLVLNSQTNRLEVRVDFSGQVCATGNVQLTGVSASNDKGGVTTQPSSTLAPGTCSDYSGSYFPSSLGGSGGTAADTVTANGTGALGTGPVSDDDPASCDVCPLPASGAP